MAGPQGTPRLEVRGLDKTFGRNQVLFDVGLTVAPGEIHGLIGENGSGKSTLVKVLTGYHGCDGAAAISVDGRPLALPVRWEDAHASGVSVVYQDLGLIDDLSVAENIGVGGYRTRGPLRTIDWPEQRRVAAATLARIGSTLDPRRTVGDLPAAQRAEVAIARALRDHEPGRGLIILDESTRSLTRDELSRFYRLLRPVVEEGTAVLLVSHSLDEVLSQTDRVTVLRDGRVVGAGLATSTLTERDLAHRMLGRHMTPLHTRSSAPVPPRVAVRGLRGEGLPGEGRPGLDFTVGRGEIVGITGLSGSGFERIPYLVSGARRAAGGTLQIDDVSVDLASASVRRCLQAGVAFAPERRDRDGLAMELSMRENLTLPLVGSRGSRWRVTHGWQTSQARTVAADLGIRPADPTMLVRQFSGGNQQKILLGKWLSAGPKLLVLHEPTQAVDIGARQELLRLVHHVSTTGLSVLVVSIEATDLAALCDRVLVYAASGRFREVVTDDPDDILAAVYAGAEAA